MSLVTTCPSCGTVFRMVREQLDASGGWVRCGHCMDVFDAKVQLSGALEEEALATDIEPTPELSFVQTAQKKAFWTTPSVRWMMTLAAIGLVCTLALQVLRFERDRLTAWFPSLAPLAQSVCVLWSCPEQTRRQIDGWLIEHSSFQKDTAAGVSASSATRFRLTVQLKNNANQRLTFPHLELSLLDVNDSLLVRKSIDLQEPQSTSQPQMQLAAGAERGFSYLIDSPALAANIVGYRLVLFYP